MDYLTIAKGATETIKYLGGPTERQDTYGGKPVTKFDFDVEHNGVHKIWSTGSEMARDNLANHREGSIIDIEFRDIGNSRHQFIFHLKENAPSNTTQAPPTQAPVESQPVDAPKFNPAGGADALRAVTESLVLLQSVKEYLENDLPF